jgi:Ca2+-binding RTX toxin-like protein
MDARTLSHVASTGVVSAIAAMVSTLILAASAHASAGTAFGLNGPPICYVGCAVQLVYDGAQMTGPGVLEVNWYYQAGATFAASAAQPCAPTVPPGAPSPCILYSPAYTTAGTHTVMIRVTDADTTQAVGTAQLSVLALPTVPAPIPYTPPPTTTTTGPPPGTYLPSDEDEPTAPTRKPTRRPTISRPRPSGDEDTGGGGYALCRDTPANVSCRPGNGMQTAGGGEKVSHKGWPSITGVFWKIHDSTGRTKAGGPDNDELLGHHGSDSLSGAGGKDVLWGDWDPANNNTRQRDSLRGGAGNDFIYPSHGTTRVDAGPGKDYIWAFYGKGVIDCGPGYDTVRVRLNGAFALRGCEVVGHFCQFGADGHGGCLKPGERRAVTVRRHP